jgi:hypothetical protein
MANTHSCDLHLFFRIQLSLILTPLTKCLRRITHPAPQATLSARTQAAQQPSHSRHPVPTTTYAVSPATVLVA